MYIIVKSTRIGSNHCYVGPTWDAAGIRSKRQDIYTNYDLASQHADILSKYNKVGFIVQTVGNVNCSSQSTVPSV